jgi:predicted HAD superfamily phosphohydrolase YqeG
MFYPTFNPISAGYPSAGFKRAEYQSLILDLETPSLNGTATISGEVGSWFKHISQEGFQACILSNNGEERVLGVAEILYPLHISGSEAPARGLLSGSRPDECRPGRDGGDR